MCQRFSPHPRSVRGTAAVKARQRGREALRRFSLVVGVQFIQFFQQGQRLASDEAGHVKGGFFLFSHSSVSPCVGSLSEVFNDTGETRKDAHDRVTEEICARWQL